MDVGADEFEQSLPLLQELVLGADFVGKTPDSGPCRASSWPDHPAEGVARLGQGREVRPSPEGRLSARGSKRPSEGQGDSFSAWAGGR